MTPEEIADKLEWEGGIGEGISYFGRELKSTDTDLNAAWRVLYDAFEAVERLLPEPSFEEEQ